MATELASGYVSIVAETSGLSKGIKSALGGVEKHGDSTGRSLGSRISSGIGKTLKVGAAATGVAVGGILAGSITKGLGRLTAIDSAEAKLSALGNSTEDTAKIMDSALESVSGTAYGLGDAATIAASAVAAGVKPGQDLTKYLSMTADAAAIAGADLSEMGSIINQVQTGQVAYTDELNQLADRGIPIYTWLAEEAGVAQGEVKALASEGAISSEMFFSAIQKNIGGAAQEIGQLSTAAAWDNVGAAAGRFGATLAGPAFSAAPAVLSTITTLFDDLNDAISPAAERIGELLTPALENVSDLVENRVAPLLGEGAEKVGELAVAFTEKAVDPALWERIGEVFGDVRSTAEQLWPSLESLAGSFFRITQNISVAVWDSLTATLNALAPVIENVLVPLVEKVAEFAEQNPGAVQAMVLAFLGFKGVGAVVGPVKSAAGAISNLGGAFSTTRTLVGAGGVVEGVKELGKYSKDANPVLSKMGKGVGGLSKVFGLVGKVLGPVVKFLGTALRFINPWVAGISLVVGALTWFFTSTETGQALWETFTTALSAGWDWVVEKLTAGWDWIRENVFSPLMDFLTGTVQPIWDQVWGGVQEAWDVFTSSLQSAWENIIRPVFDAIWQVAQVTIGVIGTIILAPLLIAWNVLSAGIQAAWEHIIKPAWDAMSAAATWLWETVLSPVFTWIGEKWGQLTLILQAGWEWIKTTVFDAWNAYIDIVRSNWEIVTNALSTAWQWVSDTFSAVWGAIKSAVFDAWNAAVGVVRSTWESVTNALSTAWTWVRDTFTSIWNAIKSAVFDAWNNNVLNVRGTFETVTNALSTAWSWLRDQLSSVWSWIKDNVFTAFETALTSLETFFGDIVDGIGRVWNGLRSLLAKPINFMINTVYNDGILKAWNVIAGILPGLNEGSPLSGIPEHATGGRINGPGTGTSDDVLMWGSNGEHMLTEKEVKRLGGHAHVYALRDMVKIGRPFSFDGSGGIIPLPRNPDNRASDLYGAAPDLLPAFRAGGEIRPMWEMQLERGHEFARAQHGKPYQWAGPTGPGSSFDCSGYMASIAAAIQGTNPWQRYWATMAFPPGAQGFAPGLGAGFSVGIWNGGPYGGHTAGTLGPAGPYGAVNVESGGSPSQVKYGVGAVGADHSQFRQHWHLPIGADGAFVSGGEGGMSPEFMQDAISAALGKAVDTFLDPVVSLLPEKPPEWQGIPRGVYESGRDGLTEKIAEGVTDLADGLATVWSAIRKVPDLIAAQLRGGDDVSAAAEATLHDSGGVWKSGTLGLNLSGADEYVFTNRAMRDFALSTESLAVAGKEISTAFHGGDWGYGALADTLRNEEWAKSIVSGAATLGTISRDVGAVVAPAAREAGEDYLAEQATSVLDIVGLGGLVPLGLKAGGAAWDAYQASPYDVGVQGQTVVVEIDAGEEDERVRMLRQMESKVDWLMVRANKRAPAAMVTRGGVI